METITIKELAKKLLFRDNKTIYYHVKNGNLPKPIIIKNKSYFEIEEINKIFGIKNINEVKFIDKKECMKILGMQSLQKLNYLLIRKRIPFYRLTNFTGSRYLFDKAQIKKIKDDDKLSFYFSADVLHYNIMGDFIGKLLECNAITSILSEREIDVLKEIFVNRSTLEKISNKYNFTTEGVRQIRNKAQRKITLSMNKLSQIHEQYVNKILEVSYLKEKNKWLEIELKKLAGGQKKLSEAEIYGQKLSDLGLSARSYNWLKYNKFETVKEVINYCNINGFNKLMIFRHFGKKCLSDVAEVFLEKFNINLYDYK
ncbi:MAG: hypothetical protein FVQ78_09805 [Solirubrobacterales bacterium]|nr:hypothetical protein [Solirubrobacterales bacterium]